MKNRVIKMALQTSHAATAAVVQWWRGRGAPSLSIMVQKVIESLVDAIPALIKNKNKKNTAVKKTQKRKKELFLVGSVNKSSCSIQLVRSHNRTKHNKITFLMYHTTVNTDCF